MPVLGLALRSIVRVRASQSRALRANSSDTERDFPSMNYLETDFLVAGGGLAGGCPAVASARHGASVILLLNRSVLGGNTSRVAMMHAVGSECHRSKPGAPESGVSEGFLLQD